jgi:hypothetical protein
MFEKRFDKDTTHERQELRDFFADRLKLALDFATLGAYELTEVDGETPAAGAERPRRDERSERKPCASGDRGAPRRHVGDARLPCSAPTEGHRAPASCGRGGRRAGGVATPEQPCTCAGR